MSNKIRLPGRTVIVILIVAFAQLSGSVNAADPPSTGKQDTGASVSAKQAPCDSPAHHQFDFWLGDWLVIDMSTNELVAYDRVEKQVRGCAVVQSMTWLTDQYRPRGQNFRFAGTSTSVLAGDKWTMLWVDVGGGSVLLSGTLQKDGSLEFITPVARDEGFGKGQYTRGVWIPHEDGTVTNTGYLGDGKTWQKPYFNYLYKPNR